MQIQETINYRWRRHVLASLFFVTLFLFTFFSSVKAYAAETVTVSIDNHQPRVGEPLNVSVDGLADSAGLFCIWTIDGKLANRQKSTYTPTVDDYEKWIMVRVYHDGKLVGSDRIWFSKLPVLYIDIIDGGVITSKTEYKSASMCIQGNSEYGNADKYDYEGDIQIKGRGNESWSLPKKPYKIKLGTSTDIFGFGKNKHWVLLANYHDESFLRNTIANEIATQMNVVGMDTTWVDVVMNGEYVGNYQFCEQIRIAESRVDIFNWDDEAENIAKAIYKGNKDVLTKDDRDEIEDLLTIDYSWISSGIVIYNDVEYSIKDYYDYNQNISGGYLLQLTSFPIKVSRFRTKMGTSVLVDKPEYAVTNDAMINYIKTYMQDYENAIRAIDGYNSENLHYTQKADFDSMVAYWLTLEICGNNDALWKSRWAYKEIDGLLTFGPVWDFDWAFGSAAVGSDAIGWKFTRKNNDENFFKEWIDDPYFTLKAQEQYWKIRPYLQSIIDDGGLVDQYNEYLKESGAANEKLWKCERGYQSDTNSIKTYLKERLIWLDEQFASQESIMESLYTEGSANPYTKSDDKLIITLNNVAVDDITEDAPADGVILQNEDLICRVHAVDENTKAIAVYVNGLRLDDNEYIYDVVDKECQFTVPAERFTELVGSKNVISLIGRDSDGAVTYTNFISVCDTCYHVNTETEIRNDVSATCILEGYTGDRYCKECDTKIADGVVIPALKHDYNSEITVEPTTMATGLRTYICSKCGSTYTENIPKLSNGNIPGQSSNHESVKDAGNIVLRWGKVKNATHYVIYAAANGNKYGKPVSTVKASSKRKLTIKTLKGKVINPNKIYKFKVKAYRIVKGKKKHLATSKTMYVVNSNNKNYTNALKIVTKKSSYKLKKGEKATIKATLIKQDKKKKLLPKSYGKRLAYSSSNKKVATVTTKGKIKAKGRGVCSIYIRSLNGLVKKIKITIK